MEYLLHPIPEERTIEVVDLHYTVKHRPSKN